MNEVWAMDYMHDELSGRRRFRALSLMDGYTREVLVIEVNTSLPGLRVVRPVERLREMRGTPVAIQVDNRTEFTRCRRNQRVPGSSPGRPTTPFLTTESSIR